MSEQYRSPVIPDMAEYFGVDDHAIFEEKEQSEGYLAGITFAQKIQEAIQKDYGDRSKVFRENLLRGMQENL